MLENYPENQVPSPARSQSPRSSPFEERFIFDDIDYQPSGSSTGNSQGTSRTSQESNYDFDEVKDRIVTECKLKNYGTIKTQ